MRRNMLARFYEPPNAMRIRGGSGLGVVCADALSAHPVGGGLAAVSVSKPRRDLNRPDPKGLDRGSHQSGLADSTHQQPEQPDGL